MSRGSPRRGFTLVELLVAIALTAVVGALVGQWIVHEVRSRVSSDRRIDAREAIQSLRSELFVDVHRGRILSLGRERWTILHPGGDGSPDTIVWSLEGAGLARRDSRTGSVAKLSGFDHLEVAWEPVPVPGFSGFAGDAWWNLDRDQDGSIDGPELDSVLSVSVRVLGEYRLLPGLPAERDSLTLGIPAAGL